MKLIGIVGQPGSGKDTAADYIAKQCGFTHISSGDVLREYVIKNSLGSIDRQNLQKIVTKLRREKGNDVLVQEILHSCTFQGVVISGLRHPDEARLIKQQHGILLAIAADPDTRYKFSVKRNRAGDNVSSQEFTTLVKRENLGGAWDIGQVIKMADIVVSNNASLKMLYSNLDRVIAQYGLEDS